MLSDMLQDLINATTRQEKERAFKALEKVGVDRITAVTLAKEIIMEDKNG